MKVISGLRCFLWGSLTVLLAPLAITALAHSHAVLASPELRTALADPSTRAAVADPVIKVPLAELEVNVRTLEDSDECVLTEACIMPYLWSTYERVTKDDK